MPAKGDMMKLCKIKALNKNERMSTQELLQTIYAKIDKGYTDFEIEALGQHDIAGAVFTKNQKKNLNFKITNPGQRVGAMALDGTNIVVEGSAPADVGWLNSGATITVKKDAGDTASHCAAGGKIYIGGRVGTRSGALMKHDPKFEPPEFWVLKNTGSFSFEFMGGGSAIICGYECENLNSVLGNRSCVGMVGGTIYFRGNVSGLASCVEIVKLNKKDMEFLKEGMKDFLKHIEREDLYSKLTKFSQWKKIVPNTNKEKDKKISLQEFVQKEWFKGGLFGDLVEDDGEVYSLAQCNERRLRIPKWDKKLCINCSLCLNNCPQKAIKKEGKKYYSEDNLCIGCSICAAVCPKKAWSMENQIL